MMAPIIEANATDTTYQFDLAFAARLEAEALHKKGEHAQALHLVEQAFPIFVKLRDAKALPDADKNVVAELEEERSRYRAALQQEDAPIHAERPAE